ncbi:MAG: hypothetical protein EBS41_03485 [Actinobacteria bacterium]|nr:hypothetical protein [Actinomycetota bacterium]
MNSPHLRVPQLVAIPAGPAGVDVLAAAISMAVADPALVIAPIPEASPHVTEQLRTSLIAAIAPQRELTDPLVQVVLTTSGSTGNPKGVMHSLAAIAHSTRALHERLGGAGHWVCALPLHTSAGFMTVARAVLSGTTATPMSSVGGAEPFTSEAFIHAAEIALAHEGRHYISLVPQQASRLLQTARASELLARFDAVLLGGQAIPADLIATLRDTGATPVLSYGSTETCGGCVYDGIPLEGISIKVTGGAVVVSGATVMRGYRDAEGSLTSGLNPDDSFTMPDRGEITDGALVIHGRSDDIIIVNGVNISPTHVEALLQRHGVVAVVVSNAAHSELIAVIEMELGEAAADEVERAVRQDLSLPLRLHRVEQWPVAASGKPDRAAISAMITQHD